MIKLYGYAMSAYNYHRNKQYVLASTPKPEEMVTNTSNQTEVEDPEITAIETQKFPPDPPDRPPALAVYPAGT